MMGSILLTRIYMHQGESFDSGLDTFFVSNTILDLKE